MEQRLHKILKTGMVVLILILAYFLPGLCLERMEHSGSERAVPANESVEEKVWHTEMTGENFADDGQRIGQRQEMEGAASAPDESAGEELSGGMAEETDKAAGMTTGENQENNAAEEKTEQVGAGRTIVLDAGHGGSDPGMVGVGGVEEKEINLKIAEKLRRQLEERGFHVVMTREDENGLYDETVSNKKAQDMQRRCGVIAQAAPVLTVSIHQNSYTNSAVCGPQVFYFEYSDKGKVLAACIQEQLNERLEIVRPRQIKANTNYYILKRSDSVTVLAECAFLSNPEEAAKIQTAEYQEKVAQAICAGILEYLENV